MSLIDTYGQARVVTSGEGATTMMLSTGNEHPPFSNTHMPDTEGCGLDGTLKDNFGAIVSCSCST